MSDRLSEVLILVSVAPMLPYPELFRKGPQATWVGDQVEGVRIECFEGLNPGRFRRQFVDLREMLRFPGARPESIGTVDHASWIMRMYGRFIEFLDVDQRGSQIEPGRFRQLALRALLGVSQAASSWDRIVCTRIRNRRRARVEYVNGKLVVARYSTVGNSMAIQQDLMNALVKGKRYRGVLFVTSSAYVDQKRFLAWLNSHDADDLVGGGNAIEDDAEPRFFSGFCQYFSWDIMSKVAKARDFDHSLPNDGAMTKWLLSHGIDWQRIGIAWFADVLDRGTCPLCTSRDTSIVRCTSHGSRWREAERMRLLHHSHP